jgi:hypothetical protein
LTAWQALIERARLQQGQKVLIHAGSGGVGTFAIQLAKHVGTTVATTTSTANVDLVRSLGADIVIDYKKEDFAHVLRDYDVVLQSLDKVTLETLRSPGLCSSLRSLASESVHTACVSGRIRVHPCHRCAHGNVQFVGGVGSIPQRFGAHGNRGEGSIAPAPSSALVSTAGGMDARLTICSYQRSPPATCPRMAQKKNRLHAMSHASVGRSRSMSHVRTAR